MVAAWKGVSFSVFAIAVIIVSDSMAQEPFRGDTVATRPRPDYDPAGVRMGSFLIYPKMAVDQTFNDNVFATNDDERSDFITSLQPEVTLASDWNNHAFNLGAGADLGFYSSETGENYQDWNVASDGRIDITRADKLFLGAGYAHLHEERGDPDDLGAISDPVEYELGTAFLRYARTAGRISLTPEVIFRRYDYQDTNARGPGSFKVNQDDRDRNVYDTGVRVGYEIAPGYEPFVRVGGNVRDYDRTPDDTGLNRDSYGYDATAGLSIDFGGVTFGDVFAGYRKQVYDDDADLNNIDGPTVGLSLDWNATNLTSINAKVTRIIEETTEPGSSGYFATSGVVTVDHELLRNLILSATGGITNRDYEGIDRDDYVFLAGAGAKYLMNRNFYVSAGYSYTSEDSDVSGGPSQGYTQNRFLVRLEGQL